MSRIVDEAIDSFGWHWIQDEAGEWKPMSHAEPEHNRPQEGEEPEEPFPFDPPYRIDNPTTGLQKDMQTLAGYDKSPLSNPTTGELDPFAMELAGDNVLCVLYDDAKAALAYERRERDCANDDYHALQQEYDKLQTQLAAERKVLCQRTEELFTEREAHDETVRQLANKQETIRRLHLLIAEMQDKIDNYEND